MRTMMILAALGLARAALADPAATATALADPTATATAPADPAVATATATAPAPPHATISLYGAIAGGVMLESIHQPPNVHQGTQNPTVAVSLLGVHGRIGEHITFASEFEATLGGPLGYGASVWEGQAALAIWDQYVRYTRGRFAIAAGRIEDAASLDYVSAHVGDLLFADLYTRDPLLYSGYDRGTGLTASYALGAHLTAGLTVHSTNPTGITGTLIVGGKLTPFDRPFYLAAAQVGNSQNELPDQNLHIYFASPSLIAHFAHVDAHAEIQLYSLDTQEATDTDQPIRGYNLRLGARAWTAAGAGTVAAFANVSRNLNEILDPTDSLYRLPDLFHSYTVSTGVDWNFHGKDGIGLSYAMVDTRQPGQHVREHYLNLGTSWWIEDSLAIGVRAAVFAQQVSGERMTTGNRSLFLDARLLLP